LTVVDGADRGRQKKVRNTTLRIGRKNGDLVLNDTKISSDHAVIEFRQGKFFLKDLNSTNGTFINDERIDEKQLKHLDEIKLGFTTLLFRLLEKSPKKTKKSSSTKDTAEFSQKSDVTEAEFDSSNSIVSLVQQNENSADNDTISATVRITSGPHRGQRYNLSKDSLVIGRVNTDIVLKDDKDVSRKHAVIEILMGNQLFIRDLASTNGTLVNGNRISHQRLKDGDMVTIGTTEMEIKIDL
jgi:pSer/pThr/pTyr-binding forkhead associated (FHA) protein